MLRASKILIVDDEPRFCKSLATLLNQAGCDAFVSENGKDAIGILRQNPFDLVLLDIVMPEIDGYQVLDAINRHCPETKVVFITGHASVDSAVRAFRQGACDYLKKPFEYEEVLKTVERVLARKAPHDESKQADTGLLKTKKTGERTHPEGSHLEALYQEIRIPLNGVVGLAELLLDTELSSDQRECVEMLRTSANWLSETINNDLKRTINA